MLNEKPPIKYREAISRLSKETGIGLLTVKKTIAEYNSTGNVSSPPKKRNKSNAIGKVCDEEQNRIRQKVHEFWFRREVPNLSKVTTAINKDSATTTH